MQLRQSSLTWAYQASNSYKSFGESRIGKPKETEFFQRLSGDNCGYIAESPRKMPFEIWHCLLCCFIVSFTNYSLQRKMQWWLLKTCRQIVWGHWISPKAADLAKKDFDSLLKSVHTELKDTFLTFDLKKEPVHSFFAGIKPEWTSYKNRWKIFKLVFTLSQGQVSVERGFSINKELLVEKLQDLSFLRGWFTIMLTVLGSQSPRFLSPVLCWKVVNWLIQGMP